MGGIDSGRWHRHRRKRTVESSRPLNVAVLVGNRPPVAGHAGKMEWRDHAVAAVASVIFVFVTDRRVQLLYSAGEERKPVALPLDLEALATPYAGVRFLALCPLAVNGVPCRRRAVKLYQPPGSIHFGCRRCHQLAYTSSQTHDSRVSALLRNGAERLFALAERPADLPAAMLGRVLVAFKEWERRSARRHNRLIPKPPPCRRKKPDPT